MIVSSRRGFIAGALALVAAPAIVRAASLMKVSPTETFVIPRNNLLTINQITRDAVEMFRNSNLIISDIRQYGEAFAASGAKIGDTLRIRFPREYTVTDGPGLSVQAITDPEFLPYLADYDFVKGAQWEKPVSALAVAIAAPVVVAKALEVPVSRRFFGKRDA